MKKIETLRLDLGRDGDSDPRTVPNPQEIVNMTHFNEETVCL